ncbi:MAG: hypothetical protein ACRD1P_04245 [Thermoanaerobaculia bacterium]
MPQTRMFRDRVVSMEQTLEGGERHLELLKIVCREAFPEFSFREHFLDHERDVFVMVLEAADGRRKGVCWTRMVLFDAERIPVLTSEPMSSLRAKLVGFLRARANLSEIIVTFRHLEEGWVETREPRREKRRRRGGRGEPRGGRPQERPSQPRPGAARPPASSPRERRPPSEASAGGPGIAERPRSRRRRRLRRRRRGRGPGAPSSGPAPAGAP